MKKLIRQLSRLADSSQYCLLGSKSPRPLFQSGKLRRSRTKSGAVPEDLPIYVGDEMEHFVVSARLLNHPIFVRLRNKSAQDEQKGVLRIPCHSLVFERVLESLCAGDDSSSEEFF